jgi:hypothetical protein
MGKYVVISPQNIIDILPDTTTFLPIFNTQINGRTAIFYLETSKVMYGLYPEWIAI